jgi:anthranilate synthase component 2
VKVLIIDNFDSFTYNLHHYVREFVEDCFVVRSNQISEVNIENYDKIILSPGPSLPSDHPVIFDVLKMYSKTKSILGICL